jgi:hypothetical protein
VSDAGSYSQSSLTDEPAGPWPARSLGKLARENGIPDYPLRRFLKARGELEARLPAWREAAKTIGLDDVEYVGGVLRPA